MIMINFLVDPLIFAIGIMIIWFIMIPSLNLIGDNNNFNVILLTDFASLFVPFTTIIKLKAITSTLAALMRFRSGFNLTSFLSYFSCQFISPITFMVLFLLISIIIILFYTVLSSVAIIPRILKKIIITLLCFVSVGMALRINNFMYYQSNSI